jgi:hypothetical protein
MAYLAGHRDMNIMKRYVYPQEQTIRAAMDRAREVTTGDTAKIRDSVNEAESPAVN